MEFFEAVKQRRSIRRFKPDAVAPEIIEKALQAAVLAPTSSNGQTWNFYWAVNPETKKKLSHYCLDQSAARTAADLIVVVGSPSSWKRSHPQLQKWVRDINAPKLVVTYYDKLFPLMYRWGFLNSFGYLKWLLTFLIGLFRPITRGPNTLGDIQEVCIKSAALASENLVLALSAQGVQSCMMEGFDEWRVKRLLKLKYSDRVVMVIGIGYETERGTWANPQFRLPIDQVVHKV